MTFPSEFNAIYGRFFFAAFRTISCRRKEEDPQVLPLRRTLCNCTCLCLSASFLLSRTLKEEEEGRGHQRSLLLGESLRLRSEEERDEKKREGEKNEENADGERSRPPCSSSSSSPTKVVIVATGVCALLCFLFKRRAALPPFFPLLSFFDDVEGMSSRAVQLQRLGQDSFLIIWTPSQVMLFRYRRPFCPSHPRSSSFFQCCRARPCLLRKEEERGTGMMADRSPEFRTIQRRAYHPKKPCAALYWTVVRQQQKTLPRRRRRL